MLVREVSEIDCLSSLYPNIKIEYMFYVISCPLTFPIFPSLIVKWKDNELGMERSS